MSRCPRPTQEGDTALTLAAWKGNGDLVQLLLAKKADPAVKGRVSAHVHASAHACFGLSSLLLSHDSISAQRGYTALQFAEEGRHGRVIRLLRGRVGQRHKLVLGLQLMLIPRVCASVSFVITYWIAAC